LQQPGAQQRTVIAEQGAAFQRSARVDTKLQHQATLGLLRSRHRADTKKLVVLGASSGARHTTIACRSIGDRWNMRASAQGQRDAPSRLRATRESSVRRSASAAANIEDAPRFVASVRRREPVHLSARCTSAAGAERSRLERFAEVETRCVISSRATQLLSMCCIPSW